ncbi:hypothetical protein DPEC_G00016410 [Dallia pectoralis]|uniref:Uncharacterized protein n=1 Tax=Dallia pectoralis TaxID=75939 RepID=A0ACC2HNM0_DALPE|nr:hypothetical protein DPEC_G00016410 [Dallia pectoralis]
MDVKHNRPLILRRDEVEGRMVARHIALEVDPSPSPNQVSDLPDRGGAGVQVCDEEVLIQMASDMIPIGAELQMDAASSEGQGSLHEAAAGEDGLSRSWFEPLDVEDFDNAGVEIEGSCIGHRYSSRRAPKWNWRRPLEVNAWVDCSALGPGWKRKVVLRPSASTRKRWDTYYCTPDGCRVRSKVELAKYFSGGVDLTHFDFSSGLFQDEKKRTKLGPTDSSLTGTPDVDSNHTSRGTPGTTQRSPQNQGNMPHITLSPTVTIHNIFPITNKPTPSVRPPSLRLRAMARTSPGGVGVRRSSQSPLAPLGHQTLPLTSNDLPQHRKVVVAPRPNLDLDMITSPPPHHLALVSQWTKQCNESNLENEHNMEESTEKQRSPKTNTEIIHQLTMANQKNDLKKTSQSIVFRKHKKFDRSLTRANRRESISRKAKIREKVKDLEEKQDKHQEVFQEIKEEEAVEADQEEGEKEKQLRSTRIARRKAQVKEKEEEWRPYKILLSGSDGSETDEENEVTNFPIYNKGKLKRSQCCGTCAPCRRPDCNKCIFCMDKPRNGGQNRRKQKCKFRRCLNMPTKKDMMNTLHKKRKVEQYVQKVPGPGRVTLGPGGIPLAPGSVNVVPGGIPLAPGSVNVGPGGIPLAPGSVNVGPGGIPLAPGVSVLPGTVVRSGSEYFILGKKQLKWRSISENGRRKGKGRPPKQSNWIHAPLSDTPVTDDTEDEEEPVYSRIPRDEEEEPVYSRIPQDEEEEPVYSRILQDLDEEEEPVYSRIPRDEEEELVYSRILQDLDEEEEPVYSRIPRDEEEEPVYSRIPQDEEEEPVYSRILQDLDEEEEPVYSRIPRDEEEEPVYSRILQDLDEEDGIEMWREVQVKGDDHDGPERILQPYPQNCYRGDHGNLQVIRMNGHQITSIIPGPSLVSSALPVFYPATERSPDDYLSSEPPSVYQSTEMPLVTSRNLHPHLSHFQPPSGGSSPGYHEEQQLVELYAEIPRTIINLGPPDLSEITGSKVMSPAVNDFTPDDITPVIIQTFSLAVGSVSGAENRDAELFGFLQSLRRTVLPAHWVGVMARGPLLQLLQCSKLSTMADTVLQIDPGFCYQVTVQGQPLLLTHPLYDAHPPRLTNIPQLVTLLLDLESQVVCPGFPLTPLPPGDRSHQVLQPFQCVRAVTCDLLVPQKEERCGRCSITIVEEDLGPVEELEFECTEDEWV